MGSQVYRENCLAAVKSHIPISIRLAWSLKRQVRKEQIEGAVEALNPSYLSSSQPEGRRPEPVRTSSISPSQSITNAVSPRRFRTKQFVLLQSAEIAQRCFDPMPVPRRAAFLRQFPRPTRNWMRIRRASIALLVAPSRKHLPACQQKSPMLC